MKLTRAKLYVALAIWWLVFLALSILQINAFQLLNIVGFSALIFCLGTPLYIALRLGAQPLWVRIGLILGLALLQLMIGVLVGNALLPHIGVARPLDHGPLLYQLTTVFGLSLAVAWHRLRDWQVTVRLQSFRLPWIEAVFLLIPCLFIAMSIGGATILNNGGTGWLTLAMLVAMCVYLGFLLVYRARLSENTIATIFFLLGVALLLMTSLRGWMTTGHDIQREFRMFQLSLHDGLWNIASYRDPYNACLSITILPTIFANMLQVADAYIYKVLFQVMFAVVPPLVYVLARRYASRGKALLAAIYFIAFPTFFSDMPMLNRQEIAFIFLALLLVIIFDKTLSLWTRRSLFMVFGLGMVVSHYSTTYSVLAILLFLLVARPIFNAIAGRLRNRKAFKNSAVGALTTRSARQDKPIKVWMVVALAATALLWNVVITNTSSGASSVLVQVVSSIKNGFKSDSKSNDTSYGLFTFKNKEPQQTLNSYQHDVVQEARSEAKPGVYFDDAIVDQYKLTAVTAANAPFTPLGEWLASMDFDVASFNYIFKQASAKLLQVFVLIGLLYLVFSRRFTESLQTDYLLIVVGSLCFVFLQLIVPVLSVEYGLLRAFQQSLMVLGLFIVVGTFALGAALKHGVIKTVLPPAFALVFFLSSTSVISQSLGGYAAQLHLNNGGNYYDIYYLHKSEVASIDWLSNLVTRTNTEDNVQSEVQSDRYTLNKVKSIKDLNTINDIIPGLVRKDSYVYLGYSNVVKKQATFLYTGDTVSYAYPTEFLDANKNLLYDNGQSRVYK